MAETPSDPNMQPATPPPAPAEQSAQPAPPVDAEGVPQPHVAFAQQKWVQTALPFVTSLLVHIGLIAIGFAGYEAAKEIATAISKEQIIIPDAAIIDTTKEQGGIVNPGLGQDPTRAAMQDQFMDVETSGFSSQPSKTLDQSLDVGGAEGSADLSSMIARGNSGTRKGPLGSGSGAGGALAKFGPPGGGGGMGPKGNLFGFAGGADRVIFICDASGSMTHLGLFDQLKIELEGEVQRLDAAVQFNIIFFREKEASAASPTLMMADAANKMKALEFLKDMQTYRDTNPIPALEMAFKLNPQLIYLLTDGAFNNPTNQEVIAAINRLNANKTVKINTRLFTTGSDPREDETNQSIVDTMTKIAEQNGGRFQAVTLDDL